MLYDRQGKVIKDSEDIRRLLDLPKIDPELTFELLTREVTTAYFHGCSTINNRIWAKTGESRSVGIWGFSGSGRTDIEGQEKITLNDYFCPSHSEDSNVQIKMGVITDFCSFVASPNSPVPVLLTYTLYVESSPFSFDPEYGWPFEDIELTASVNLLKVNIMVYSWNLDRTPAPHLPYSWISLAHGGYQRLRIS